MTLLLGEFRSFAFLVNINFFSTISNFKVFYNFNFSNFILSGAYVFALYSLILMHMILLKILTLS